MLKSEVQHQFWITKKAFQRKLGSKEDEHIISSDAELDAKIEVFKSISDTSNELSKIIDQYQDRLFLLSQEECVFGRFLKEVGKRSKTTGSSITNTGKGVSYCGQQRLCVRVPLLRLQHELEVFRCRAIRDTLTTIQSMEKERTEYRAALSWMKSASSELDPDTGRGLDKFRTAQSHVRAAKQNFDSFSLNSVQKIDLLAAARCNMYSHALISYMAELKQFAQKTASTFEAISKVLLEKPKYDFCILKDLTQEQINYNLKEIGGMDTDQALFFSEYVDDQQNKASDSEETNVNNQIIADLPCKEQNLQSDSDSWLEMLTNQSNKEILSSDLLNNPLQADSEENNSKIKDCKTNNQNKASKTKEWMELFRDLDPFANPEAFDLQLSGGRTNFQQT